MVYWKEVARITGDIDCYYYIIKLSYSPLVYDTCATVLNHLTCLFLDFYNVFLFCYYEDNSSSINSVYGDMRYMVYI